MSVSFTPEVTMTRLSHISAAAVAATLALGCAEQHTPTAPAEGSAPLSAVPSFARGENGAGGGGIGRGGELGAGFWFSDPERGLTTVIGIPADGISDLRFCGGTEEPEAQPALFVLRPDGGLKLLLNSKETSVAVWQLVSGDLCGVLATTEPYAVGTAHLRLNDNEASDFPIAPGGNSASLHASGTVTVVGTGEELNYQAVSHTFLPKGATSFDDIRILQSEIRLH
jgi:hypothetical protein